MKDKIIIFDIVLNRLRKKHVPPRPKPEIVLTPKWIKDRINIFMNNTFKSLRAQTNQNFIALIRYEDSTEKIIQTNLKKYSNLPKNIIFIKDSKAESYILSTINKYKDLYLVRLDSDDMYHRSFVNRLHKYRPSPRTKVLINQRGFIYDRIKNRMAIYKKNSPPFYVLIYRTSDYLKGVRHPLKKHNEAIFLPHEILKGNNFIVNVHSRNTSTKFRTKNKRISPNRIKTILKDFKGE